MLGTQFHTVTNMLISKYLWNNLWGCTVRLLRATVFYSSQKYIENIKKIPSPTEEQKILYSRWANGFVFFMQKLKISLQATEEGQRSKPTTHTAQLEQQVL